MCKVSDKLKLCTCKTVPVTKFKNYWVLNRACNTGIQIVGCIIPLLFPDEQSETHNRTLFLKMLNAGNCFDTGITPGKDDVLELHFTSVIEKNDYLVYAFSYRNNRWHETDYDVFGNGLKWLQGQLKTRLSAKLLNERSFPSTLCYVCSLRVTLR